MNVLNLLLITISVIMECFVLIYFSNVVLEPKHSKLQSNLIIILGYSIYGVLCLFENPIINITGFFIVTFCVLRIGFKDNTKSLILKTIILMVLMMFGELLISLLFKKEINSDFHSNITVVQNIVFAVVSKIVYSAGVFVLRFCTVAKVRNNQTKEMLWVLLMPLTACIYFSFFNRVCFLFDDFMRTVFLLIGILLTVSSFIVYMVCDRIVEKNEEIQHLQKLDYKKEIDKKSYELIKSKYNDLRTMVHDFNKYCNNIEGMLNEDREEARSFIKSLENKNKEFMLIEHTNNRALNIVLSQKYRECNSKNIDFQVYIQAIDLSFLSEIDTVSIFANLLDNAIEGCAESKSKKIFLNVYQVNGAYVVFKVENSSDNKPNEKDGILKTSKKDYLMHGIGMESIKKALSNYNGQLRWEYNEETKIFKAMAMIAYYDKTKKK